MKNRKKINVKILITKTKILNLIIKNKMIIKMKNKKNKKILKILIYCKIQKYTKIF